MLVIRHLIPDLRICMTTLTAAPLAPEPLNRFYLSAGWVLIALGLLIPLIAMSAGYIDGESAKDYITRGVGSLLFLAGIGWLATRKMSNRAKANARIVVGILLCLVVFSNVNASVRDEAAIKVAVRDMLEFEQRQSAKLIELDSRIAKLPMGEVLSPEKLASPHGIEYGRAVIAQFRAMLAERQSLLQSGVAEADRLIDSMPTERTRQIARQAMKREMVAGLKYQIDLNRVQGQGTTDVEAVLNWAGERQGTIQAVNGTIMFAKTKDLAEYRALVQQVLVAGEAEEKLTADAVALRAKIESEQGPARARVEEFLQK